MFLDHVYGKVPVTTARKCPRHPGGAGLRQVWWRALRGVAGAAAGGVLGGDQGAVLVGLAVGGDVVAEGVDVAGVGADGVGGGAGLADVGVVWGGQGGRVYVGGG